MPETLDNSDSKTILFVEDEAALRTLLCTILNGNGYSVIVAANGQEAIALARKFDGVIHLLLSDFVMPGITGAELAKQLRPERPDMKVMLISGYAEDIEIRSQDSFALLQKPFSPAVLLQQIVKLLSGEIGCPLCKKTATYLDAVTYYCVDCDHEWKRHANGSGDGFVRRTAN